MYSNNQIIHCVVNMHSHRNVPNFKTCGDVDLLIVPVGLVDMVIPVDCTVLVDILTHRYL